MPMTLLIETDGGISEFAMKPIGRKTRQGATKRLAIDFQGRECGRALMTCDGLVLPSGTVADIYEAGGGNSLEHREVVAADSDGNILRNLAATTGRPQRPIGPVSVEEVLDCIVTRAYALCVVTIARDIRESLGAGDIYRVAFRPRASVMDSTAFLLANDSGVFLLRCEECRIEFIRLDQPVILAEDVDDEEIGSGDEWKMAERTQAVGGEDEW